MPASDTQSDFTPRQDAVPASELELRRKRLHLQAEAARLAAEAAALDEEIARATRLAGKGALATNAPTAAPVFVPQSVNPARPESIPSKPSSPSKPKKKRFLVDEETPPSEARPTAAAVVATSPEIAVLAQTADKPIAPTEAVKAREESLKDSNADQEPASVVPSRLFITVPSWAVSMIVHMVLIIILAICTITPKLQEYRMFEGSISSPIEELLEEQVTEIEFEAPNENTIAAVLAPSDMGMADLGNVTEVSTALASIDNGDLNVDVGTNDFGQLFGSDGAGMAALGQGTGGAEFFGVKATGRKFVFVVDSSRSMQNGKFEDACEELFYAIQRLKSDQYFYVIFFDQDAARMTFAPNTEPEMGFARAITPNLKKLDTWMKTVELEGQTNPYDALVFARSLSPDAIYILTDGQFTDRGRSVAYLKTNNLYKDPIDGLLPKSVIHTVGFYDPDGEETLTEIAKDHAGTYRFVPRPNGKMKKRLN